MFDFLTQKGLKRQRTRLQTKKLPNVQQTHAKANYLQIKLRYICFPGNQSLYHYHSLKTTLLRYLLTKFQGILKKLPIKIFKLLMGLKALTKKICMISKKSKFGLQKNMTCC